MSKPIFSIITVVLNPGVDDLLKTVNSVISQGFRDWELIIKDGGSTDGCLGEIPSDARIRVYEQKDAGIFDAMNQSLDYATGEFICFLNAGDFFYDEHCLRSVADVIRDECKTKFFYGDVKTPTARAGVKRYPNQLSRYYLFTRTVCHQAWFVKRRLYFDLGGFNSDYTLGGDYRFLLRALIGEKENAVKVPRILIDYKGCGVSTNTDLKQDYHHRRVEIRKDLFSRGEYIFYSMCWAAYRGVKILVYDHFLCRIHKIWCSRVYLRK